MRENADIIKADAVCFMRIGIVAILYASRDNVVPCRLMPRKNWQLKHPDFLLANDFVGIRMSVFPRNPSTVQTRPQPLHASLIAAVIRSSWFPLVIDNS